MMVENMTIMFEALGGSTEALKQVDPAPVAGLTRLPEKD